MTVLVYRLIPFGHNQTVKMLRIGLVLLLATSALAGSRYDLVTLDLVPGKPISQNTGAVNHLTDCLSSLFNGGDLTINTVTLQQIENDIGSIREAKSQVLATSQSIATSLGLAVTEKEIESNACVLAALIDAYPTGNYRAQLKNFINLTANVLYKLVVLKRNPKSRRLSGSSATGPGCYANGRIYKFEAAWNAILGNATPANAALLDEEYCTVRRMYSSFGMRSNHIAAAVTAMSLPPVQVVLRKAHPSVVRFVTALCANSADLNRALLAAQEALIRSV